MKINNISPVSPAKRENAYLHKKYRIGKGADSNNMMDDIGVINPCVKKTTEKIIYEICQAY